MTGFGIYLHWPFCESKCPYCDFNSHVADSIDQDSWARAYVAEITRYGAETYGRTVTSIFFGGGTPTLMKPKTLATILEAIGEAWTLAPDVEITAEANPSSAEISVFRDFRAAGVNRLSLGVQSFDPAALKFLGRRHDADQARRAIAESQAVFPRTSFDLIYARPDQTAASWNRELDEALSRAGEHLSVYQLTIEPGTEFRRRKVAAAEDELATTLYEITQDRLNAAGLPAYEVSNHARPGAECRHNLVYWRGEDYVGIGPGAHGRLTHGDSAEAVEEIRSPGAWLAAVTNVGSGTRTRTSLSKGERFEERVLMGLRLSEGIPDALAGKLDIKRVNALIDEGYLARDAHGLRTTAAGMQRLNSVISYLIS